jgi:hypothetical protein
MGNQQSPPSQKRAANPPDTPDQTPDSIPPHETKVEPPPTYFATRTDQNATNTDATRKLPGNDEQTSGQGRRLARLEIPKVPRMAVLALAAIQHLPTPLIVLSSLKTVVLANEAMGRVLGLADDEELGFVLDGMRGKTLSQVGIDLLHDGKPIWVIWETFLDTLADEQVECAKDAPGRKNTDSGGNNKVSMDEEIGLKNKENKMPRDHADVQEPVVEVLIATGQSLMRSIGPGTKVQPIRAKMIITPWKLEDERYITLTFTKTEAELEPRPTLNRSHSVLRKSERNQSTLVSPLSPCSTDVCTPDLGRRSSTVSIHGNLAMSSSPFPPLSSPLNESTSAPPSALQKLIMMKDALMDTTDMPIIAMWKDESLTIPNTAARRLFHQKDDSSIIEDGHDLITRWRIWDEDFKNELDPSEHPISVLVHTQQPFSSRKIGMYDPSGKKLIFDVLGEAIVDEQSGDFLAGITTYRDITAMTVKLAEQIEMDKQRFQTICDSMPQMVC